MKKICVNINKEWMLDPRHIDIVGVQYTSLVQFSYSHIVVYVAISWLSGALSVLFLASSIELRVRWFGNNCWQQSRCQAVSISDMRSTSCLVSFQRLAWLWRRYCRSELKVLWQNGTWCSNDCHEIFVRYCACWSNTIDVTPFLVFTVYNVQVFEFRTIKFQMHSNTDEKECHVWSCKISWQQSMCLVNIRHYVSVWLS